MLCWRYCQLPFIHGNRGVGISLSLPDVTFHPTMELNRPDSTLRVWLLQPLAKQHTSIIIFLAMSDDELNQGLSVIRYARLRHLFKEWQSCGPTATITEEISKEAEKKEQAWVVSFFLKASTAVSLGGVKKVRMVAPIVWLKVYLFITSVMQDDACKRGRTLIKWD